MREQTRTLLVIATISTVFATVLVFSVMWIFPTDDYSRTGSGCVVHVHKDSFTFQSDPGEKLCSR